jgi:hypothetical protein
VVSIALRIGACCAHFQAPGQTLVFTAAEQIGKAGGIQQAGAEGGRDPLDAGRHVDCRHVARELGRRECIDVLVEAGPTAGRTLSALGLCGRLIVYIAPNRARADGAGHVRCCRRWSASKDVHRILCSGAAHRPGCQTDAPTSRNPHVHGIVQAIGEIRALTPRGGDVELLIGAGTLGLEALRSATASVSAVAA